MSLEAGVVVLKGGGLFWHVPGDRTAGSLPDSRALWDVFWENRDLVEGFAHSHPGKGIPGPSHTDITTFEAVERGLGRKLKWWIITEDHVGLCKRLRRSRQDPREGYWRVELLRPDQPWLEELRRVSYETRR